MNDFFRIRIMTYPLFRHFFLLIECNGSHRRRGKAEDFEKRMNAKRWFFFWNLESLTWTLMFCCTLSDWPNGKSGGGQQSISGL